MKRILILVNKKVSKHEILLKKIKVSGRKNADPVLATYKDIEVSIFGGEISITVSGVDIKNYNLVYLRTIKARNEFLAGVLAVYLSHHNIPFIDSGIIFSQRRDKLTSTVKMALAGLPVIDTYYCDFTKIAENVGKIRSEFNFPLVAKNIHEHYLKGIYVLNKVSDFDKLFNAVDKKKQKRIIFQPYINIKKEYRLVMLGREVASVNVRIARNCDGIKLGYKDENEQEEYIDVNKISSKLKMLAINAVDVFDYQICGVDICIDGDNANAYILEVNRSPGFNYDSKVSPEIEKVSNYILSKCNSAK